MPALATAPARARMASTLFAVLAAAAALLALLAPGAAAKPAQKAPTAANASCGPRAEFLGFSDALNKRTFEGTTVGGLSALVRDPDRGVYYSLVDNGPTPADPARFYTLRIPFEGGRLGTPEILDVTVLRRAGGAPFTASDLDGEGIALTPDRELLVASETEPSIRRFSLDGELLGELPVPQRFRVAPAGEARANQTFESLSLTPEAESLFTAVEGPLASDGMTSDGRARIRILRYEENGATFSPAEQFFYLAESGQGVVEILALSERRLLVLERGFVSGQGNTVRIFEVKLSGARDVSGVQSLAEPGLRPVNKKLLVDLADCPPSGATTPGTQRNPLLDNFESLAFGPDLSGGRRTLILQSDDNFSPGQVTRVLALGVRRGLARGQEDGGQGRGRGQRDDDERGRDDGGRDRDDRGGRDRRGRDDRRDRDDD